MRIIKSKNGEKMVLRDSCKTGCLYAKVINAHKERVGLYSRQGVIGQLDPVSSSVFIYAFYLSPRPVTRHSHRVYIIALDACVRNLLSIFFFFFSYSKQSYKSHAPEYKYVI